MTVAAATTILVGREQTARDLTAQINQTLENRPVDLAVLFASAHFEEEIERVALEIHDLLKPRAFIGSSAEGVIAGDKEFEGGPALALWAAHLPGAHVASFHLSQEDVTRLDSPAALREHLGVPADEEPSFVLLGDPFSVPILDLLERLNAAYPNRPVVGGMASAAERPGQNAMVFDGQILRQGACGAALWGDVEIETVVSQGCRPVGRPLVITKSDRNVIYQLGGKPALQALNELLLECPPRDTELMRSRGLLVGRVIDEYQQTFARGDFLIRNLMGLDPKTGALAVNDLVRTGQTVQFHVRDESAADEDLHTLLANIADGPPAGALLFSCNGRGTRLFSEKHHDARAVQAARGAVPLAGFFCAGEIGPVGRKNFLHGHTASIGLFRPARQP